MVKLKIRPKEEAEIEIAKSGKVFKYARGDEGMHLVEVEGEFKTPQEELMKRLKSASAVDCAVCLQGELWSKITGYMWFSYCDGALDDVGWGL